MPTHAQLAAKLLLESAKFYRAVGNDNPEMRESMESMASACDTVASLVASDPNGELSAESFTDEPNEG